MIQWLPLVADGQTQGCQLHGNDRPAPDPVRGHEDGWGKRSRLSDLAYPPPTSRQASIWPLLVLLLLLPQLLLLLLLLLPLLLLILLPRPGPSSAMSRIEQHGLRLSCPVNTASMHVTAIRSSHVSAV